MKLRVLIISSFSLLFMSTNFANKYVLTVLKFTYPTLFQGWQTLVGILVFRFLYLTGNIEALLHGKDWFDCALWLPGLLAFLISIYSGSRALSSLPIPIYLAMQNIVLVFKATADLLSRKQITSLYSYFMLMVSLVSGLMVAKSDPEYDWEGYFWISFHVISLGALEIYTHFIQGKLKFSFAVLAPASYFLGDTSQVANFPYLNSSHFYVGCLLSGILGVLLNLCSVYIQELKTTSVILDIWAVQGIAKIVCSAVSVAFFDMTLTQSLAVCLGYIESTISRRQHTSLNVATEISLPKEMYNGSSKSFLKRQELQQDMIRIDLV